MSTDRDKVTDEERKVVNQIAEDISENTKLSKKQATALILKEVMKSSNEELARILDVASPASASSYVTRCRSKFDDVETEIKNLEREIQKWENTKRVEQQISSGAYASNITHLDEFRDELLERFETRTKYLVRYLDDEENERVDISHRFHPSDLNVPVIEYKRIQSVDELF